MEKDQPLNCFHQQMPELQGDFSGKCLQFFLALCTLPGGKISSHWITIKKTIEGAANDTPDEKAYYISFHTVSELENKHNVILSIFI